MSEPTVKPSSGNAGSFFFLYLLLLALLLGVVTASAIRHNPLYSDRDSYGISKYQFIESCKEYLHRPGDISVTGPQGTTSLSRAVQQSQQPLLQPGETLAAQTPATSRELVAGVQQVKSNQIGIRIPLLLSASRNGTERPLLSITLQCLYEKGKGLTAELAQ